MDWSWGSSRIIFSSGHGTLRLRSSTRGPDLCFINEGHRQLKAGWRKTSWQTCHYASLLYFSLSSRVSACLARLETFRYLLVEYCQIDPPQQDSFLMICLAWCCSIEGRAYFCKYACVTQVIAGLFIIFVGMYHKHVLIFHIILNISAIKILNKYMNRE